MGLVLSQENDTAGAANVFRELVRRDRNFAEAHYNLALALHQEGKEEESRAEFEKAYDIAPELRNAPRP